MAKSRKKVPSADIQVALTIAGGRIVGQHDDRGRMRPCSERLDNLHPGAAGHEYPVPRHRAGYAGRLERHPPGCRTAPRHPRPGYRTIGRSLALAPGANLQCIDPSSLSHTRSMGSARLEAYGQRIKVPVGIYLILFVRISLHAVSGAAEESRCGGAHRRTDLKRQGTRARRGDVLLVGLNMCKR